MAKYVWTAKDKFGVSVVRAITANTIEESKSMLLAEGCTELVLKEDEIMDAATAGMPRTVRFLGEELKVTEADKLKQRGKAAPTYCSALWQGMIETKGFIFQDYAAAKRELEASLEMMQKTPNVPFRAGHISVAKAYLCCVLAKQGDVSAARKNFLEAEDYLVATREDELLAQCKRALGE